MKIITDKIYSEEKGRDVPLWKLGFEQSDLKMMRVANYTFADNFKHRFEVRYQSIETGDRWEYNDAVSAYVLYLGTVQVGDFQDFDQRLYALGTLPVCFRDVVVGYAVVYDFERTPIIVRNQNGISRAL